MDDEKCIVVNVIGGPGTGKSILSSDIFSNLKKQGISCDVSWEYIKRKLREKALKVVESQIYVFGKQQFQMFTLKDEVDVIITDSPLLLSPIYDKTQCPLLKALVIKEYNKYNNLLFFIERDTKFDYETEGRYQDLSGAKEIDNRVLIFLNENKIPFKTIKGIGQDSLDTVINDIIKELKK